MASLLIASGTLLGVTGSTHAIEYWWNQNGATAGWGGAGTWDSGNPYLSTTNSDTATAAAAVTTTSDILNIGTSTVGHVGGTLKVSGTRSIGSIITGSANHTADILVNTGTLNFAASGTITNNSSRALIIETIGITGADTRLDLNANGGAITMSTSFTYTGITYVNSGTVFTNNVGSLGASGTDANRTVVASGARIVFNTSPRTYTERFEIAGAGVGGTTGALVNTGGYTTNLDGLVTLSGNATVYSDSGALTFGSVASSGGISLGGDTLTFEVAGGTQTVSNTGISGVGGSIVKSGAFGLDLNVDSTYSGGTTLSAGTINLGASTTPLGSTSGQLTVNAGTLNLNNTNLTVGNLTGSGGIIQGGAAGTRTLTIGEGDTGGGNYQGQISDGTGTTALTKVGTGAITLSGANDFTGATAVNAGKLVVAGSLGATAVSVSNAGTVLATDAAASFGGSLAIGNGAILAAGDAGAAGTATLAGAATFNNGSIFSWDVDAAGTSYDKLVASSVAGEVSPGDAFFRLVVADSTFAGAFWNANQTWTDIFTTDGTSALANWADIFTLSVVDSSFASLDTSAKGTFSITGNTLSWTAVPEPTSGLAGILLGVGLLRRRRKGVGNAG